MGSGGYSGPPIPPLKPFNDLANKLNISGITGKTLAEFGESCGILAIMKLIGYANYTYPAISFIKKLYETDMLLFIEAINKVNSSGLGITDIINIVTVFNDHYSYGPGRVLIPDMRYNSHIRDLQGTVFRYWHRGIAALKFKNGNNSHWIYFGYKECRYGNTPYSIELLKNHYPKFDGLGHTVVFHTKGDFEAMKNTHSNPCDHLMCEICGRKEFCFERKLS